MTTSFDVPTSALEFDGADRARRALRVSGVGVTAMAEYLGITRETASRYINGKAEMPLQAMRLWALRTGVPFEWLRDGSIPSGPENPDGGGECAIRDLNPEPAGSGSSGASAQVVAFRAPKFTPGERAA